MAKNTPVIVSGSFAALALGICWAAGAMAQQPAATEVVASPGGVPFGAMTAYPAVDLTLGHDDNVIRGKSGQNKRSSSFMVVSPSVRLEGKSQANLYSLTYRADIGRYRDSSADNYNTQKLSGLASLSPTARVALDLRGEYARGTDARGSNDRALPNEPDRWHSWMVGGVLGYGAPGAQGRIELEAGYTDKEYDNNRASRVVGGVFQQGTEFLDRADASYGGTFFWRVAPKTQLLFQVRQTDIDYDISASTLDSKERRYLAGVTWTATAKTTGIFKIGRLKKDFDSSTRSDSSESSWEGTVQWKPLTYSTVDITTGKQMNEVTGNGTGSGDFISSKNLNATWTHSWKPRFSTSVSAGVREDDYQGSGATRSDDTDNLGLGMAYQMRRGLKLGANYTHTKRDSNVSPFDYSRNVIMFTVGAAL